MGSVLKPCRTLFVGSIACRKYADPRACEAALWRGFGEWGEVENVNLISRLSIAFVRFRSRAGAEFAKEAMANQTLEHEVSTLFRMFLFLFYFLEGSLLTQCRRRSVRIAFVGKASVQRSEGGA